MKISTTLALTLATVANGADTVVRVPIAQPPTAKLTDSNFIGMSFEFQYWPVYAGNATGKPNKYVNQLLENLRDLTGKPPAVRVGGTSENLAFVDSEFQLWNSSHLSEVYGPFTNRSPTAIGRDWYVVAGNLPKGTEFTFGLNLYDKAEVIAQAKMINEAFLGSRTALTKDVSLKYIQIGNEPNFYFDSAPEYVQSWKSLVHAALKHIKLGGKGQPSLWIGSETLGFNSNWGLRGTLDAGVLEDAAIDNACKVMEEHAYSGALSIGAIPGGPPPGTLMNKATIRSNLTFLYDGKIATEDYGKTYYMGETSSYASEGIFGLSNTGESAVWAVDYLLKMASMGVARVYLHSTPNRMFASFQPGWNFPNGTDIQRPHIMPMYNGIVIVDEFIGKSGNTKIAEIENNNMGLATYGAWENGKLARLVLINSNVYDSSEKEERSAIAVDLEGGYGDEPVTVKRLAIPSTMSTQGITWGGQSFETESGVPSGAVVAPELNGRKVVVEASEVVMLIFSS